MANYFEKNRIKFSLLVVGFLVIMVLIGLWLRSSFFHSVEDIRATVQPNSIKVGDTLFFKDKTTFSALKEWRFGDGNIAVTDSGYHIYSSPGYYQVKLTLNGEYSKTFPVQVFEAENQIIQDSVPPITGPKKVMQNENAIFRANSETAELFSWKFGESGIVDSKEQIGIYAYQKPGVYTVSLTTDEMKYPVTHQIQVTPSFKESEDSESVTSVFREMDNDFKERLQKIADGGDFNSNYNYLLWKYLCNKENIITVINSDKTNGFYNYATGLGFDKDVNISKVRLSFDKNMNCVTKIEVKQN